MNLCSRTKFYVFAWKTEFTRAIKYWQIKRKESFLSVSLWRQQHKKNGEKEEVCLSFKIKTQFKRHFRCIIHIYLSFMDGLILCVFFLLLQSELISRCSFCVKCVEKWRETEMAKSTPRMPNYFSIIWNAAHNGVATESTNHFTTRLYNKLSLHEHTDTFSTTL